MQYSFTIARYLLLIVLPYFVFSWLLLSVILFVQQASRFSDIFFSVNIPPGLIWQLTFALVPTVIAFTCPMATLVGVIIGLAKMQTDNELTAVRAAGVGQLQITLPFLVLGVALSLFAFLINLYGVPFAARIVRRVAMQTAIYKLESPIEPGVFNTEIAGYTIYVKGGDLVNGQWKNIFIYNEDKQAGVARLITSDGGRIDYSGELSELVLENAVLTTLSRGAHVEKAISERVGEVRYAIKTRRGELIQRLSSAELTPEELGLAQLSRYAGLKDGKARLEAHIVWQRRIVLSLTPLIFCLLGTSLMLRFNRRGRGFGILMALLVLLVYFFLAFLGEQLARTGWVSVLMSGLIPVGASFLAIGLFSTLGRFRTPVLGGRNLKDVAKRVRRAVAPTRRNVFVDLTTGLRDFDIAENLLKYYLLSLAFLGSVFVIFTAFELWKFAGTFDGGIGLLLRYLFFLLPFVYLQLSASAVMIGTLATYVIKSRQNEIVTWTSAGQSAYRLLLPCLILMLGLGVINFQIQEYVLPRANQIQDDLRELIRGRGEAPGRIGPFWTADDNRIYSFRLDNASDNENLLVSRCPGTCVQDLSIFQFSPSTGELESIRRIPRAALEIGSVNALAPGSSTVVKGTAVKTEILPEGPHEIGTNVFLAIRKKPSHLNIRDTRAYLAASDSPAERRTFAVALEKKYTTALMPFIVALFTAPFALSMSRKGKVVTIGYAVVLWLLFMAVTNTFEQFGAGGLLTPAVSVWGPLAFFSALGIFLLSRVKT